MINPEATEQARAVFEHLLGTSQTDSDDITLQVEEFALSMVIAECTPQALALLAAVGLACNQAAVTEWRSRQDSQ